MRSSGADRATVAAASVALVAGAYLRLRALSSDPIHPTWRGWMQDEGRWTELPREWALFGAPELDTTVSSMHLLLSPLYQMLMALVFTVAEPSFLAVRIPSALAGLGLLAVIFFGLRNRLHPRAWLVTVAIVAFHPELVYYSRVAIPEMIALLLHTCAFLLLVSHPPTRFRAAGAGLATCLGVLVKVTTLPVVPAFAVASWAAGRGKETSTSALLLKGYGAGLAIPVLIGLPLVLPLAAGRVSSNTVSEVLEFVELNSPYAVLETLRAGQAAAEINYLLVALWPLLLLCALWSHRRDEQSPLLPASLAWIGFWLVGWVTTGYFPDRWMVHVFVPLAVALGVTIAPRSGSDTTTAPVLLEGSGLRQSVVGIAVALPLAVVSAPLVVASLEAVGFSVDRFRQQVALVFGLGLALAFVANRSSHRVLPVMMLGIPLAWAAIWRLVHAPGIGTFWSLDIAYPALSRIAILTVAAGLIGAVAYRGRGNDVDVRFRRWTAVYVASLLLSWTVTHHLPTILNRSDAGSGIASGVTVLGPEPVLSVARATSFVIPTSLRYREITDEDERPAMVLVAFWSEGDRIFREGNIQGYEAVDTFEVPGFARQRPRTAEPVTVLLYERAGNE